MISSFVSSILPSSSTALFGLLLPGMVTLGAFMPISGCPSTDVTPTPVVDCSNPLDLQSELDSSVSANRGFGGGVYRIDGPCGVRFEGISGNAVRDSGTAMETHDTFEVASVTKTFTATTILLLVEAGQLSPDQTLGALLPADLIKNMLVLTAHDYTPEITVRQLLNHTSGLPDFWSDPPYETPGTNAFLADFNADENHFWEPEEVLSYIPDLYAIAKPGAEYHYSDTNYVLLGLIIESLTGQPLDQVFRQEIFAPLGMHDTYLSYHEAPTSTVVESHRYEGSYDLYARTRQSADWASGGLVSSTRDLSIFMHALAEGEIFADPATLEDMRTTVPTGQPDVYYGLGIFVVVLDDGGELWGHDGYGTAFMYYSEGDRHVHVGTLNQTNNDWWSMVYAGVTAVRHP